MRTFAKSLAFASLLSICAAASDRREIEGALKQQYHDRMLTLRHPLLNGTQRYDSTGKLMSPGPEGAWTLYSGMRIRKISLQSDKLQLQGYRTYFLYRQSTMSYVPDKGSPMKVEVLLEHPCASASEARAIIEAIFAVSDEDLLQVVPVYWKPFLAKRTGPKNEADGTTGAAKPISAAQLPPGVIMPRAIYTPEPEFTEQARKRRIEGLVVMSALVNPSGRVGPVRIVRPAGMGLDEAAVAAVQNWKFAPATRDGEPVPVEMVFEISFNLYK